MLLVKDLNKDIFPSKFLHLLPEYCEYCDSPIEVIESFNALQCSNPHCISKLAYRLYSLLLDLGNTTFNIDECMAIIKNFEMITPYSIFIYNPYEDGELYEGYGVDKSIDFYNDLNKRRGMLLWEYIKIGNIDYLASSCEKIFKNYSNLYDFYNELNVGGIPFVQSLLLDNTDYIDKADICVDAVLIYESLIHYKAEFFQGLDGVVIIEPDIKFSVLFATNVANYNSNRDFLYMVNRKLKNKIYFYPVYTLNSNVDFLYWDNRGLKTVNSLVKDVMDNYKNIIIVNSDNIFDKVLEVLSG